VAGVAVPSFLLVIGVVAGFGLSVTHPEAGVVSDLFAGHAVLLAVIL
jgi:hypothetical protein